MAVGRAGARILCRLLAATTVATALVSPGLAQGPAAYRQGLDAVASEDWEKVERLMRQAIAERSEARRRRRQVYIPHYYLGLARFRLGDCKGALAAWAEAERQGPVMEVEQGLSLQRGRRICEQRADNSEELEAARQDLRAMTVTAASLLARARQAGTRDIWERGDPSPAARHTDALARLDEARSLLAPERVEPAAVSRALELVRQAGEAFATLDADVSRLTRDWNDLVTDKKAGVAALAAAGRSLLSSTRYLAPFPRGIRKGRADLEGLLGEAERMQPEQTAEYLEGLRARLENSMEHLRGLTEPPPASLRDAAEAFLRGDYADVVEKLADAELGGGRTRAHAALLLAASRFALYLEGGEAEPALLETAAQDVRRCRESDAGLRPSARLFSPRFLSFFEERAQVAQRIEDRAADPLPAAR